jgi:hypothetical protein
MFHGILLAMGDEVDCYLPLKNPDFDILKLS